MIYFIQDNKYHPILDLFHSFSSLSVVRHMDDNNNNIFEVLESVRSSLIWWDRKWIWTILLSLAIIDYDIKTQFESNNGTYVFTSFTIAIN